MLGRWRSTKNFLLEDKCGASCTITASKLKTKPKLSYISSYSEDLSDLSDVHRSPEIKTALTSSRLFSLVAARRGISSLGGETRSRHQMLGLVGRSTLHKPKQQRKAGTAGG